MDLNDLLFNLIFIFYFVFVFSIFVMIMVFVGGVILLLGMIKEWNLFVKIVKNDLIFFEIVYEIN